MGCVEACPGCRYRHLTKEESDQKKQHWIQRCLGPLGLSPLTILTPTLRWGYRRKVLLHARLGLAGWELGLLRRYGWEAELVPIPSCPVHDPILNRRAMVLRSLAPKELPWHSLLISGSIFTLVLKSKPKDEWREWASSLEPTLLQEGVASLQINWNPSAGRRVLSSRHQELIFGPGLLKEGALFYGATSFRQQISELENAAMSRANRYFAEIQRQPSLPVVDLFSGSGSTLALWQRNGWRSAGVELAGEACRAAGVNAPAALVLKGRCEDRIPQLEKFIEENGGDFLLYTNPPRDGHSPLLLKWILQRRPLRVAYLSCNQRSLARDLEALSEAYNFHENQPLDFFPQTDHVESLTLMERKGLCGEYGEHEGV